MKNVLTMGPKFTWSNKIKGRYNIKEKLDRFLANNNWCATFPNVFVRNCGFYGSDHRAIKIFLNHCKWVPKLKPTKQFAFENKWLLEDDFVPKAADWWRRTSEAPDLQARL